MACAVAARSVEPLALTSTIRARPDSLKCVNSAILRAESARRRKKREEIIGAGGKGSQGRARERPGALFARRTRTIGMCSFDARSKRQPWPLPLREVGRIRRPSIGLMARLGVPVGRRVRKLRAVGDSTRPPPWRKSKLGKIGGESGQVSFLLAERAR